MARTPVPVTALSDAGVADPAELDGDTVNGNTVPNTGRTILRVRNANVAAQDITFITPVVHGGKAVADTVVSIPAGTTRTFGAFSPSVYTANLPVDVASADLKLIALEP